MVIAKLLLVGVLAVATAAVSAAETMQLRRETRPSNQPRASTEAGEPMKAGSAIATAGVEGEWVRVRNAGGAIAYLPSRVVEPVGSCDVDVDRQFQFLARHYGAITFDQRFSDSGLAAGATRSISPTPHRSHTRDSLLRGLARYEPGTAVLLVYYGASAVCTMVIDAGGIIAYAVNRDIGAVRLEQEIGRLLGTFVAPPCLVTRSQRAAASAPPALGCRHTMAGLERDLAVADELSRIVIPPAIERALIARGTRNLIVVPHGMLSLVPFGALRLMEQKIDLVERFSITLAPAFTQIGIGKGLHLPRAARSKKPRGLIVGNPTYRDKEFTRLGNLPGAEEEARLVAHLLSGTLLTGDDATLDGIAQRLKTIGPGNLDILYLASHGIASRDDPVAAIEAPFEESFVALSGGERLSAGTLRQTGYRGSRLVVLSACVTGRGWISEAGSVGLPRLFHLQGAEEVVMSLWQVDDAATRELMSTFADIYLRMWPDASAAKALQEASVKLRATYRRPAYWAAFSVFGVGPF
jgi:CHAT domain-containing protein